jgi:hypothetical protein
LNTRCFQVRINVGIQTFFFKYCSSIGINQLPVSTNMCLYVCQICFATFDRQKITKLLITQQPWKVEKKKQRFRILFVCLTNLKKSNYTHWEHIYKKFFATYKWAHYQVFASYKLFQPSLMFVGKSNSLP